MRILPFLLAMLAVGPPLAAQDMRLQRAINDGYVIHGALSREVSVLHNNTQKMRSAHADGILVIANYKRISAEHDGMLEPLHAASIEIANYSGTIEQQTYEQLQAATGLNCSSAGLAESVRELGRLNELGKLLSFGLGMAAMSAISAASASTSVIQTGGSVNSWNGVVTGGTTTITQSSFAAFPFIVPFGIGGMGGGRSCTSGSCVVQPQLRCREAKCIEPPKNCVNCVETETGEEGQILTPTPLNGSSIQ